MSAMGCEIGFEVYITLILMRRYERWALSQKLKVRQRELHAPDSILKPSAPSVPCWGVVTLRMNETCFPIGNRNNTIHFPTNSSK